MSSSSSQFAVLSSEYSDTEGCQAPPVGSVQKNLGQTSWARQEMCMTKQIQKLFIGQNILCSIAPCCVLGWGAGVQRGCTRGAQGLWHLQLPHTCLLIFVCAAHVFWNDSNPPNTWQVCCATTVCAGPSPSRLPSCWPLHTDPGSTQ